MSLVIKIFVTSDRTSKAQNISTFKRMTSKKLTCRTKSFVEMLLSSNFSLVGKENMSPEFDFIDAIEKLKFTLPFLKCLSDTKLIFLSFLLNKAAIYWKIFLASLSFRFSCNLTSYIKLPVYVRTSCWSDANVRQTRFHEFHTNWKIQSKCRC